MTDFPFFKYNPDLIYCDNAATTQKPQAVIDAMNDYYCRYNAPVHRGIYSLAEHATQQYENARSTVASFIGAHSDEIIFTKGTTESINLIASAWAAENLKRGDEIVISELEHHSNIIPWLRLEQIKGIHLKYIPLRADGTLNYDAYCNILTENTKLVSCTHTSNVLGVHTDLEVIIKEARKVGARVLIDAAQAAMRYPLQMHSLGADFLAFSGHKMLGPSGIGVLYMGRSVQSEVQPYQVGGGMVYSVDFHEVSWNKPPLRYEAGTPPIAQAIGLAAAINYIQQHIIFEDLKKHEASLTALLINALHEIPTVRLLGPLETLRHSGHIVSFVSSRAHPHDIAAFLDKEGICVRAGTHCAQPLHKQLGINGSVRVSFALYNTIEQVKHIVQVLQQIC